MLSSPHDRVSSVIVVTLVPGGTPARCFLAYAVSLSIPISVNRGCPGDCSYEEPKEVKKRK